MKRCAWYIWTRQVISLFALQRNKNKNEKNPIFLLKKSRIYDHATRIHEHVYFSFQMFTLKSIPRVFAMKSKLWMLNIGAGLVPKQFVRQFVLSLQVTSLFKFRFSKFKLSAVNVKTGSVHYCFLTLFTTLAFLYISI